MRKLKYKLPKTKIKNKIKKLWFFHESFLKLYYFSNFIKRDRVLTGFPRLSSTNQVQ